MKKKSLEDIAPLEAKAPAATKAPLTATAPAAPKASLAAPVLPTATEDKALTIKASTLGNGQTLQSVTAVTNGHAKVTLNKTTGNITFTPDADFSGVASFQYTLGDGSVHTANIDVTPVADAPKLSVSLENGVGAATRQGTEFLVNTTTSGGQFLSSVATAPDGSFVMAWTDTSYSGDNFAQVRAQRFNADGTKNGNEFRVNTTTGSAQEKPKVAILANGDFAITWSDEGQDSGIPSIKARVFHADGTAVGGAFLVNTTPHAQDASITALSGGGFVVSWEDDSVAGDSNIKAQVFLANGTPAGSEFVVSTITSSDQNLVSLASLKGGGFVATWQDNSGLNNDGTREGSIKAQMFNADGSKNGSELLVDSANMNWINDVPNVTGLSDGGFAVTWDASSNVGDTNGSSIQLRTFHPDSTGKLVAGKEVQINTSASGDQLAPKVVELSNHFLVVVWQDQSGLNGDASGSSIKAQVVDASGNRVGGEFLINQNTAGDQQMPSIAALPNGGFIVNWTDANGSGGDGNNDAVKAQIFSFGNAAPDTAVKLNLAASTTDKDNSETLTVSVSNLLEGSILTDGTAAHYFKATATQTSVDVTGWDFSHLTVTPPSGFLGDLKPIVTATSIDHATLSTGSVNSQPTSVSQTIDIVVAPLKGAITDLTLSNGGVLETRGSVAENAINGTVVGTVQGVDSLPGAVLTYAFLNNSNDNGAFAIDAKSGIITVANGNLLDFESPTLHAVQVLVTDQTGASFHKTINIDLTNVNERPTDETLSGGSVIGGAGSGTSVGTVKGIDPDAGSVLSYSFHVNADNSLANANGAFAINASTGDITVADSSQIDFAAGASRTITVRVTDQGGLYFDKTFDIAVTDPAKQVIAANETISVDEDNQAVITIDTLTHDSTHPAGAILSIDSVGNAHNGTVQIDANGNIAYQPNTNFSGTDTFSYTLTDHNGHSSTATVTVNVNPVADAPNLSVSTSGGSGAVNKVGVETQVNTTEIGGQFLSSVASDRNGNYVVTWSDTSYQGLGSDPRTDFTQIRGQYYAKDGTKIGAEFQVSTDRTTGQNNSKVSFLDNGDFVVAWQTEGTSSVGDTDGTGVKAQVFKTDGTHTPARVGSEFQVNSTTAGDQGTTSVTSLGGGRFAVAWQDNGTDDPSIVDGAGNPAVGDIKIRIFQDNGTGQPVEVVPEFRANTTTLGAQQLPSLATLKGVNDGGFVAVWTDYGNGNDISTHDGSRIAGEVIARMFDKDGNPLKDKNGNPMGELVVNTAGADKFSDVAHVIGLANGGFAVAWEDGEQVDQAHVGQDTEDSAIVFQIFDANGHKVGGEIQVNTTGEEYQRDPQIVELTNGNYFITWKDESQTDPDPTDYAVRGQLLDAHGNKLGSEFVVNTITAGGEQMSSIAALPDGSVVVTWTDDSGLGHDTQDDAIKMQIFTVAGVDPGTAVHVNLAASLTDPSEQLSISASNIPVGTTLTDGNGHTFQSSAGHTGVDISAWTFSGLRVTAPIGFTGDMRLTFNATSTEQGLPAGDPNKSKTVSQTIDFVVSPKTSGGTGNDVLVGGPGNDVLTGGGGNDTYQFARGDGQDRVVNGTATSTAPSGELDFGAGVSANQLWFQRNGNDLSIAVMGSHDQVAVAGWFGGAGAQLAEITAGGIKIDAGVSQLVQAMATYTSAHAGFDPTTATQAPSDAALQNTIAAAWHA